MDKKNYSIIIAILLIALLIVAMICIGCDRRNDSEQSNVPIDILSSGDEMLNDVPDVNQNVEWDDDGTKINVSESINKEKMTFGDFDLTDISFKFADGVTDFTANVKNNSDKDYPMGLEMKIIFYDNDENVILETYVMTSSLLANGESNIQSRILQDCSYAETFKIIVIE